MSIRSFYQHKPAIAQGVFVDPTALVIGDVVIGEDSSVWPMAVIRGDVQSIRIGQCTSIQDGCVLHVTHRGPQNPDGHPLQIGNYVTVGHKVTLHGCTVDDHCLLGMGSIVMDGAHIEEQVILGAGSLVPPGKTLEGGFLWVGSPVKKVRSLTEQEKHFLSYAAENYKKLKDSHIESLKSQ